MSSKGWPRASPQQVHRQAKLRQLHIQAEALAQDTGWANAGRALRECPPWVCTLHVGVIQHLHTLVTSTGGADEALRERARCWAVQWLWAALHDDVLAAELAAVVRLGGARAGALRVVGQEPP